ncbi:uncharacterized protein LOC141704251 [Apium graveolens]|uniref:uncharacterized protein LOC141704251 n=1 Tax=Apium graveolens TaxID=4045 RepID=UPI003D7B4F4E
MEDHVKLMEKKLKMYNQRQDLQNKKFEDTLVRLMQSINEIKSQMKGASTSRNHGDAHHRDDDQVIVTETSTNRSFKFTPKLDFPKFDGSNPRNWIKKCTRYFDLCKIVSDQKVSLASLYMVDKAESWVTSYLAVRKFVEWDDFIIDLISRFRDDSADSYVLDSFVGGLKATMKPFVKAFKPANIADAIEYVRLKEESLAVSYKSTKPNNYSTYSQPKTGQNIPLLANTGPPLLPTPKFKQGSNTVKENKNCRFIPADVRAEKIAKGLCYYCDQAYERGHKCKFKEPQLFTVEVPGKLVSSEMDLKGDELTNESFYEVNGDVEFVISVNALAGNQNFQTMRLKGISMGKPVHILVDSGSTHNFLDINFANKLGCKVEEVTTQTITVVDGNHIICKHVCKEFSWIMNGKEFTTKVMLISLGSCDMVLGIQWLSILGPVYWDFKKLKMEFILDDEQISLKGIPQKKVKVIEGHPSVKLMQNAAHCCLIQVRSLSSVLLCNTEVHSKMDSPAPSIEDFLEFQKLKQTYVSVFDEPKDLPPTTGIFDHKIPLKEDEGSVNIRPYRYHLKERDIIEQLIQEMLERGLIQGSSSPFASPVVLVGKKDGTRRLCIYYRELNRKTIKDKFPIPVIDELIDELSGAKVFCKLDLRSGYHQLRLHLDDVFKTAFKTYTGHYKFLVMPFGLTNAQASFQSWMNAIFRPLLRKSVLVFFDDVLVYSKNRQEHWLHLEAVLQLMSKNDMHIKPSKCFFVVKKIEYLGHLISKKGIETNPQKLAAVNSWQVPNTVKELREFLGLAGYYRKFVKDYALISKLLTDLLRIGAFQWSTEAQHAFEKLKQALTTAPVLDVPDFEETFVIETYASKRGIGAFWLSKLLGFEYEIQYKHGKENIAADALLRAKGTEILCLAIFVVASNLEDLIKDNYKDGQWLEVVDGLSKYAHFMALSHPYTAVGVAQKSLFSIHGTKFLLSSAYHHATDDQTEVVNRMTPYKVVYGQPPPLYLPYLPGEVLNDEVDRSLQRREQILIALKNHLTKAQQRMKNQADKHRFDRNFSISDWIIAKIGKVAYKLKLPSSVGIHDVFHVSQLKAFHGDLPLTVTLPTSKETAAKTRMPQAILDRRVQKVHNAVEVQFLVHWKGFLESEATWEVAADFFTQFPEFPYY